MYSCYVIHAKSVGSISKKYRLLIRQGFLALKVALLFEEIGLTRREQYNARRDLERPGVWEEALRGMSPSRVARIRGIAC